MYNDQFNRHNVGVNKSVQIHFTMWCFPSCQNDRGRFCSFLRGLAAPFPCGSLIDAFPGSSAGGSSFSPMIESIFSHTSASLASAGCAGSSCCLRRALVRSLQRHSTLRATPRQKKSSFPRASVYVALLSSDLTRSAVSLSQPCKKCFVSPMHLPHIWQSLLESSGLFLLVGCRAIDPFRFQWVEVPAVSSQASVHGTCCQRTLSTALLAILCVSCPRRHRLGHDVSKPHFPSK